METNLSQNGGSLLTYAVSRLRPPDVFSHPIWVYFGENEKQVSAETIEQLLSAAKQLQKDDPEGACQILLVCAVHQNYAGQRDEALESMGQILSLAEHYGLEDELLWAGWGASAICVQRGDTEGAGEYLQRLQIRLRGKDEWVLANFVETVEQSMCQGSPTSEGGQAESPPEQDNGSLMRLTFDWLRQWGFSARSSLPEFQVNSHQSILSDQLRSVPSQPLLSNRGRHRFWGRFKQILRGELKLRWVANGVPPRPKPEFQNPMTSTPLPDQILSEAASSPAPRTITQDLSQPEPATLPGPIESTPEASLLVYCLGIFQVYQEDQLVDDWSSSKGKSVFKYLVTHRERPVIKDVLMELFWPGMPAESARNNLNVAIYGLRQALHKARPSYSHVLFINDCYLLNPELQIWLDYKAFMRSISTARKMEENGHLEASIREYSKAETLYQGEFLEEDRYEDWVLQLRENLRAEYLGLLDQLNHYFFDKQDYQACITLCHKMLSIDSCNEEAHRYLMRCFLERGQSYMALRQFHLCVEALKEGLNAAPSSVTRELYETIRHPS